MIQCANCREYKLKVGTLRFSDRLFFLGLVWYGRFGIQICATFVLEIVTRARMTELTPFTNLFIDALFVELSKIHRPVFAVDGAIMRVTKVSFEDCYALALVSRRFARAWRTFEMTHLMAYLEALERGKQLTMLCAAQLSRHECQHISRYVSDRESQPASVPVLTFEQCCTAADSLALVVKIGACDADTKELYSNTRCVQEALRELMCKNIGTFNWMTQRAFRPHEAQMEKWLDKMFVSAGILPNTFFVPMHPVASLARKIGVFSPFRDLANVLYNYSQETNAELGYRTAIRLANAIADSGDAEKPVLYANDGLAVAFTALRFAFRQQCFCSYSETSAFSLPHQLFARSDARMQSPLMTENVASVYKSHPAIVLDAIEATQSEIGRIRTLAFILHRCVIAALLFKNDSRLLRSVEQHRRSSGASFTSSDRANLFRQMHLSTQVFRRRYGIKLSNTGITAAADMILQTAIYHQDRFTTDKFLEMMQNPQMLPIDRIFARQQFVDQLQAVPLHNVLAGVSRFHAQHPGASLLYAIADEWLSASPVSGREDGFFIINLPQKCGFLPPIMMRRFYAKNVFLISVSAKRLVSYGNADGADLPDCIRVQEVDMDWERAGIWTSHTAADVEPKFVVEWHADASGSESYDALVADEHLVPRHGIDFNNMLAQSLRASPLSKCALMFQSFVQRFEFFINFLAQATIDRTAETLLRSCTHYYSWCITCALHAVKSKEPYMACSECSASLSSSQEAQSVRSKRTFDDISDAETNDP